MSTNLLVKLPATKPEALIGKDWFETRDQLIGDAKKHHEIRNRNEFETAAGILQRMTKLSLRLEKLRKEVSRPFQEATKLIKRAADNAAAPLEEAREGLREILNSFAGAQKLREREEEEKFRRNCEKLLCEHSRLQSLAVSELGAELELFSPELPSAPCPGIPMADSVAVKEVLGFELINESLLPREFFSVDERKIRAWISQRRDELRDQLEKDPSFASKAIPGLLLKLETEVVSR
ncbi:MAG: hypothetical protein A2X49_03775 [Lentisphaerae bacterium GWF2_52_8]|nr:MAG: hypothetical protein A2X49_03775 [Lentisphaerae bacterium GWF2_52_8]